MHYPSTMPPSANVYFSFLPHARMVAHPRVSSTTLSSNHPILSRYQGIKSNPCTAGNEQNLHTQPNPPIHPSIIQILLKERKRRCSSAIYSQPDFPIHPPIQRTFRSLKCAVQEWYCFASLLSIKCAQVAIK
jgi:hypothetical protein